MPKRKWKQIGDKDLTSVQGDPLRLRDIAIREKEVEIREEELRKSRSPNPVTVAVVAAVCAALITALATLFATRLTIDGTLKAQIAAQLKAKRLEELQKRYSNDPTAFAETTNKTLIPLFSVTNHR